jgi:hypothetical protein
MARLTWERDRARSAQAFAESQIRVWQSLYEMASHGVSPSAAPTDDAALDRLLRQLLVAFHPDRWCQGQLATELAHEITVVLNRVREQGHA